MKNKNNKLKLFRFLSIIYNPNKYPCRYNIVNNIANKMFCKNYSRKLLKNFSGSDLGYYIDINNDLFDLDKFVFRINNSIKYAKKDHNLLWGFFPSFNRQDVKQEFLNKINNSITLDNKKILLELSKNEINKLRDIETLFSNKREIEHIKYISQKCSTFEMVRHLDEHLPLYFLKNSIRTYLYLWYLENRKTWSDTLKNFNNPIIQITSLFY